MVLRAVNDNYDPWDTETNTHDSEYNPREIISKSTDGRGHHVTISVSLDPSLAGKIAEYVASPLWPRYTTQPTFIRDAIWHRLHYVATVSDDTEMLDGLHRDRISSRSARRKERMLEYQRIEEEFRDNFDLARQHGDTEAIEQLRQDLDYAIEFTPGQWGERLIALRNRYA